MRKILLFTSLCMAFGLGVAQANEKIKIGVISATSGPVAHAAETMNEAVLLVFKNINEHGGIGEGMKIEPVMIDSGCNGDKAKEAFEQAVNVDKVTAIIGPTCSIAAISAHHIPADAGILTISASTGASQISDFADRDLFFRTVPGSNVQAKALSNLLSKYSIKKVAVLYAEDEFGQGLYDSFSESFAGNGGEIVAEPIKPGNEGNLETLKTFSTQNADALIMFSYGQDEDLELLNQAINDNLFPAYFVNDAFKNENSIEKLGQNHLGAFFTMGFLAQPSYSKDAVDFFFEENSQKIDKDNPESSSYDAAFLMALALERQFQSNNRLSLKGALREVASAPGEIVYAGDWEAAKTLLESGEDINYQGAVSDHDFDEAGDTSVAASTFKIYNAKTGTFEAVKL